MKTFPLRNFANDSNSQSIIIEFVQPVAIGQFNLLNWNSKMHVAHTQNTKSFKVPTMTNSQLKIENEVNFKDEQTIIYNIYQIKWVP